MIMRSLIDDKGNKQYGWWFNLSLNPNIHIHAVHVYKKQVYKKLRVEIPKMRNEGLAYFLRAKKPI